MSSAMIQLYLQPVLEAYFHADGQLRFSVLELVTVVLYQGLIHPGQVRLSFREINKKYTCVKFFSSYFVICFCFLFY